jgi:MoaA/NifB/PqqE/SkfB family radical SAM enzyme
MKKYCKFYDFKIVKNINNNIMEQNLIKILKLVKDLGVSSKTLLN